MYKQRAEGNADIVGMVKEEIANRISNKKPGQSILEPNKRSFAIKATRDEFNDIKNQRFGKKLPAEVDSSVMKKFLTYDEKDNQYSWPYQNVPLEKEDPRKFQRIKENNHRIQMEMINSYKFIR